MSDRFDLKGATPIEEAVKALAQLSDREWAQVKDAEDRRRAEQRKICDLAEKLRDLRRGHRGGAAC